MLSASLKRRANAAYTSLNTMQNVSTNPVEGALYALAKVDLSKKFIAEAQSKGVEPDFLYCMKALEETGCILTRIRFQTSTWHLSLQNYNFTFARRKIL